jgi:hypothetical protein
MVAIVLPILVAAGAAAWYAFRWEPRSHVPADVAYWYRQQYVGGQLRPGWVLRSVGRDADHPAILVHRVEVPSAVAGDLVMMGQAERRRLVGGIACPPADHPIWSKLRRSHDVVVVLSTDKGDFATVPCRNAVF